MGLGVDASPLQRGVGHGHVQAQHGVGRGHVQVQRGVGGGRVQAQRGVGRGRVEAQPEEKLRGDLGCCLCAGQTPAHTWRLSSCLSAGHTLTHPWRLGYAGREPCLCPTWGHLAPGSWHWTQGF
uniref:Uncharacterized protein n=1 Tax=Populus trichocarpa TaxID=3694 RepID=A0A2K1R957_POPTR